VVVPTGKRNTLEPINIHKTKVWKRKKGHNNSLISATNVFINDTLLSDSRIVEDARKMLQIKENESR